MSSCISLFFWREHGLSGVFTVTCLAGVVTEADPAPGVDNK
jgi:hypothetical protein